MGQRRELKRDRAGAVSEGLSLHTHLVQQGQVQVCDRRRLGQCDVTATRQFAAAPSDEKCRKRVGGLRVAVGHVRAVKKHHVIQKRAFAVRHGRQLAEKLRETFHVPGLNLDEHLDPIEMVRVMRDGVERLWDADVVIGLVRSFRGHHEIMASNKGSTRLTPAPFRKVRRDRCFRVRNISHIPKSSISV